MKLVGKVPAVKERLTMVEVIRRLMVETSFKRKVWMGSRSLLIWRGMKDLFKFHQYLQEGKTRKLWDCEEG